MFARSITSTSSLAGVLFMLGCGQPANEGTLPVTGTPPGLPTHHSVIEGRITDLADAPLDSVLVIVTELDPGDDDPVLDYAEGWTYTGPDGTFRINALSFPPDPVRAPDGAAQVRVVVVGAGSRYPRDEDNQPIQLANQVLTARFVPLAQRAPVLQVEVRARIP